MSLAVVVLTALAGCGARSAATPAAARRPVKVNVVVAKKTNVPMIIARRPATTRALNEVTIRARVKGFLTEKRFQEGSDVKPGALLLVIDEEPFKIRVALAQANLEEASASLDQARQSKAREIADAQLKLSEAQLNLDQIEERRERSLLARKATSQEDFDKAVAKRKQSEATVESNKANAEQQAADFTTKIKAAQAQVDQMKADLDNAKIDLGYCRMSAPIGGRIGELQVKVGNLVGSTAGEEPLVTIQQLNPMGVDINPSARYLAIINKLAGIGLPIEVSAPRDGGAGVFQGKIIFVDNKVESTTSTVLVRAQVDNPDASLLPGEFVTVNMNLGEYVDVVLIPERAMIQRQEGTLVLVVDGSGKVATRPVQAVLDPYQGLRIVESGLTAGDQVVVEGIQLARPGDIVTPEVVDLENYQRADAAPDLDSFLRPAARLNVGKAEAPAAKPVPRPATPAK